MANDINSVVLIGRVTRDAELKYTNAGTAICKFSIASNKKRKSGNDYIEEVSYFDITIWGKFAESISQYLNKGQQVCINGELRQNRWEQDGKARSKVEIVASNLQLIGSKNNSSGNSYGQNTPQYSGSSPQGAMNFEDDIPF